MRIYLLFLYVRLIMCRVNERSRDKQLNANSELGLRNDLNRNTNLYGYDGQNKDGTAFIDKAMLSQADSVERTGELSDNSYLRRLGSTPHGDKGDSSTALTGTVQIGTRQNPKAWRVAPNQRTNIGRSTDAFPYYDQEKYLRTARELDEVNNVALNNIGGTVPIVRDGEYFIGSDGNGPNFGRTNHIRGSTQIANAESYGHEANFDNVDSTDQETDVARSHLINDIKFGAESQVVRHVHTSPDPEIERFQQNPNYSTLKNTANRITTEDSINNDRGGNANKGIGVPDDGDGVLKDDDFASDLLMTDGYDSSYVGNKNAADTSDILSKAFSVSNIGEGAGGLDYNMLAPDFDNIGSNVKINSTK